MCAYGDGEDAHDAGGDRSISLDDVNSTPITGETVFWSFVPSSQLSSGFVLFVLVFLMLFLFFVPECAPAPDRTAPEDFIGNCTCCMCEVPCFFVDNGQSEDILAVLLDNPSDFTFLGFRIYV